MSWFTDLAWLGTYLLVPSVLLYLANELWYQNFGQSRNGVALTTGLIGVPVHELSHALAVKIFGMSVLEIALYKPDPESKSLGYVNYGYRPANIVHGVGRFFVGIAPLIGGSALVYGLLSAVSLPLLNDYPVGGISATASSVGAWISDLATAMNTPAQIAVIVVAMMIATHATPSKADMRGAASGIISLVCVYVAYRWAVDAFPETASRWVTPYVDLHGWTLELATLITQMAILGAVVSFSLAGLIRAGRAILGRVKNGPKPSKKTPQPQKPAAPGES